MGCATDVVVADGDVFCSEKMTQPLNLTKIVPNFVSRQNTGRVMAAEAAFPVQLLQQSDLQEEFAAPQVSACPRQFNKLQPQLQALYRLFDENKTYAKTNIDFQAFLLANFAISRYTALQLAQLCASPVSPKQFGGVVQIVRSCYYNRGLQTLRRRDGAPTSTHSENDFQQDGGARLKTDTTPVRALFDELKLDDLVQPGTLFAYLAGNGHQVSYQDFHGFVEQLLCGNGMEFQDFVVVYSKFAAARREEPLPWTGARMEELSASDCQQVDEEFTKLFQ